MWVDHLERHFQIRVDRNDSQDRGIWDLPLDAVMLPYGAIYYHGAPAALPDIPLGTHLHGLFYRQNPDDKTPLPARPLQPPHARVGFPPLLPHRRRLHVPLRAEAALEDRHRGPAGEEAHRHAAGRWQAGRRPKTFDLLTSTRVMKGSGFADLKSLEKGQAVLFNLTWVTLYGPGRITDVWLDEPSRQLAAAQQLERHRNHIRERGLPGWVTAVDDEPQIVTITFFGGSRPGAVRRTIADRRSATSRPAKEGEDITAPRGTIAVARDSLMTYDPVNDRKGGTLSASSKIPVEPGSAGVQISVKCDMMLEGFRPSRIVRFYPSSWKVMALPREEQFFGRD